jgi:hypothetical protein
MTIVLATKRADFAVVAADRQLGRGTAAPTFEPKVYLHPSLPLAFAAAGLMVFTRDLTGRTDYVTAHLEEIARGITSAEDLIAEAIAERVREQFQPAMDLARDKVQVFIALVKDGKADVGVQRVNDHRSTDDPTRFIPGCRHYIMPCELWDFYGRGDRLEALHEAPVTDPEQVARLTRGFVQEGIDQECALNADGKNKAIGGDIDVVLVTTAGARLLPSS